VAGASVKRLGVMGLHHRDRHRLPTLHDAAGRGVTQAIPRLAAPMPHLQAAWTAIISMHRRTGTHRRTGQAGPSDAPTEGPRQGPRESGMNDSTDVPQATVDLEDFYQRSNIGDVIEALDRDMVGLVPVKTRIREVAALLLVESARRSLGLQAEPPSLHMCFTGNPGTGKTTVAQRMAEILNRLGYIRRNHVVTVSRDDLVGQYIGHTAPKTKEVLKKAMGGVLFIDEAYYLYRPENERDYGQEAIEILLQVMEDRRDDLVVILAGYKDRMDIFFKSNPGMASRIAHHIDFPDYSEEELFSIALIMIKHMHYLLSDDARDVLLEYIGRRMRQPRFSNARSIRNALDRARLRQANRLFAERGGPIDRLSLQTITGADIRASRVFSEAT
jgi:probable Rubsico expression protein CbbX